MLLNTYQMLCTALSTSNTPTNCNHHNRPCLVGTPDLTLQLGIPRDMEVKDIAQDHIAAKSRN